MSAEKDIAFQAPVEMQIANELAKRWPGSLIKPNQGGRNSAKDFEILRPLPIEIKCDYMAKKSRNLFFEVFNPRRDEPSGLTATHAWKWVHYVPGMRLHLFIPQEKCSYGCATKLPTNSKIFAVTEIATATSCRSL